MRTSRKIAGLGGAAALLAGGMATAQPPRPMLPPDTPGPPTGAGSGLRMPADPAERWLLQEGDRSYELQLSGTLAATAPDRIRVERGADAPDAVVFLEPNTLFFLEGEPVTSSQLPLGAQVHAVFDLDGNRRVARRVEAAPQGSGSGALGDASIPPVSPEIPGLRVQEELPPAFADEGPESQLLPGEGAADLPDYQEVPGDAG